MKKLLWALCLLLVLACIFVGCDENDLPAEDGKSPAIENDDEENQDPDSGSHIHAWGDWEVTKNVSAIEAGEKTRRCTCGATQTEEIPVETQVLFAAGENQISTKVFHLLLSRLKGSLYFAGEDVDNAVYWTSPVLPGGETRKTYYTAVLYEKIRSIAASLYLYDELGLELSDEAMDTIDSQIAFLVEEREGSQGLNAELATYGTDLTALRESYIIEEKIKQLKNYLYGENGSLIASTVKEEFYKLKYCRGYQMLFANYYCECACDEDGNAIYYITNNKIAYDTQNGIPTQEIDCYGDTVYRTASGEIAYDKQNGEPKYLYDEYGEKIMKYYTEEQMEHRLEELFAIASECENNPELFLEYAATLSDNVSFNENFAPNGMYFSADRAFSDSVLQMFIGELRTLEIGECAILGESGAGYYLLIRVQLDEGAWSNVENNYWFSTFAQECVEYMMEQRIKDYLQYVIADNTLIDVESIVNIGANLYY